MEQDKRSTHQARLSIGARPALRRTEIARLLNPNHGGTRCGWGLLLLLVSYPCVYAAPQGGKIVAGQGDISQPSVTTTVVKQATPRMAIDWQQFNIAEQEQVRFEQPSADAAVLNRIHDQRPSEILGSVQANGRVFLINPNGLLFGANAQVNVGALVASSLDLSSQAFMEGESRLQALDGEPTGMIINQGLLRAAAGGSISLVGAGVINQGTIEAYQGSVNLAAGRVATVAFDSDGLVRFQIDEGLLENATELSAAVTNQGVINAAGGQVLLSGHATQQVFDSAVNNEGVIRAGKIEQQGGVIRLVGVGAGVTNSGELDVSSATQATGGRVELSGSAVEHGGAILADSSLGRGGSVTLAADGAAVLQQGSRIVATGQQGGDVTLTGERVGLFADAQIDASGELAGGTVLIGGDLQGQGALPTARQTVVDKDVKIRADARLQGDAGKVIVWSDELTQYHGSIDISGGALDGAGGFAEVSGKQRLNFFGTVDASAPHGNLGTVLLDPKNIIIENAGVGVETDTVNFSDAADPGATDTRFDGDDLAALDANVVLQANNDITVNEAIPKTPGVGRTLTLQAGRSVLINANIATESGDVTIVANETVANGVVDGERDAGAAQITMADGITISAGNANINITMSTGAGLTNSTSGDITLEDLTTTGNITVTNNGTTANSDILSTSAGHRVRGNNVTLTTTSSNGAIGTSGSPVETSVSAGFTANAANGAGSMYIEEGGALLILSMDAGSGDISLGAGGQITEAAGQDTVVDITADELRITGAAGVGTATLDALNLDVTSLRVDTSSSHLFFSDKENGLALRTVNANGNHLSIVALLGDITDDTSVLTANNLTLQASAGGVGIGGAINTTTAGTMTLTSGGAGSAGNITLAEANAIATSNVTLSTAGTAQTISLTTPGSITVDGNVGNSTDNLVLTTTGSNFVDGGATLTANDLTLTASNTNAVIGATGASAIDTAVSGSISATASSGTGGVFINNTGALNVASINAATGNVELAATGAITDSAGNDSVVDITANALTIASAAGVGSAALDALNASVDSLAITTSSADVFMTNAKDLALGTLNANANDLTLQVSGDITDNTSALTAATLSLTANGAGSTIGADGSAININLSAGLTASATSGAGGVYIDDAGAMLVTSIDAGSGDVKLTAGGVITDTAGDDTSTDITANNLTIASAAGLGVSASNSLNLDVNGLILTSSSADVYLTDASDLALGTINANANDLTIQALAGNLTDATSVLTAQDATLSVAGANAAIGADGVGININLSGSLTANAASGSGGVYIDAAGAMVVASIDAGSGVVKLDALGSITDAAGVDSVTDITANSLQVVSAAGLGASATDSLNLDVSDLSVASASGDVFLTNALALGVGTLNANANDIRLQTFAGDITDNSSALSGANVTLVADAGGIGTSGAITTTTTGNLQLTTGGAGAAGNIQLVESNALATSRIATSTAATTQTLTIAANTGSVSVDGALGNSSDHLILTAVNGGFTDGGGTLSANNLTLTAAPAGAAIGASGAAIETVVAGVLNASASNAGGGVYIDNTGSLSVASIDAGTGVVSLGASGALTDAGGDDTSTDISGASLTVTSAAGIGGSATDALNLDVNGLIVTSSSADVFITNANSLALGTVNANANDLTLSILSGNLTDATSLLSATDVTLSVAGTNAAIGAAGAGAIQTAIGGSLVATANNGTGGVYISNSGALRINAIDAASGDVQLRATGALSDTLGADTATDISAASFSVVSSAGIGVSASDALNLAVDDLVISNATGAVYLTAANGIALGTVNANSHDLSIRALLGDITDNNSALTAANLALIADAGGLGTNAALTTAASGTLQLTTGASGAQGDIRIETTGALATAQLSLATASDAQTVRLDAQAGAITVDGDLGDGVDHLVLTASAGNLVSGGATLRFQDTTLIADALDASIGTSTSAINLAVGGSLTASARNGAGGIYVQQSGDLSASSLTAGSGTIWLNATGTVVQDAPFTANQLTVNAAGAITLGLANLVTGFSATNSSTQGAITFVNAQDLMLGAVDQSANAGISIHSQGAITQTANIDNAGGPVLVRAVDEIQMNSGTLILGGNGALQVQSDNGSILLGWLNAGAADVTVVAANDILNNNGFDDINVTAANAILTAGNRIGATALDPITIAVRRPGTITLTKGADRAHIVDLFGALINFEALQVIAQSVGRLMINSESNPALATALFGANASAFQAVPTDLFSINELGVRLPCNQQSQATPGCKR